MIEIFTTKYFDKWIRTLKNTDAQTRTLARIRRIESTENFGDVKSVGESVFEIRVGCGTGYRVYYLKRKNLLSYYCAGGINQRNQKIWIRRMKSPKWLRTAMNKNTLSEIAEDDLSVSKWNIVNFLETDDDMARYLDVALEENDPVFISTVLGDIARVKGMTQMAEQTGLARSSLYKALSPNGNPEFSTILKVIHALGLKLRATTTKAG